MEVRAFLIGNRRTAVRLLCPDCLTILDLDDIDHDRGVTRLNDSHLRLMEKTRCASCGVDVKEAAGAPA